METIVLVTGGFDPLHRGHIDYFNAAKEKGDLLVVGVNSDKWLTRKKGKPFMSFTDRRTIIDNLQMVDFTYMFNDDDNTANDIISACLTVWPHDNIIFANGGDRSKDNIPEIKMYGKHPRVSFIFGVGGIDKVNSSSWILDNWKAPRTMREWGYYRVLHEDGKETKVKELTVNPGHSLSLQRHMYRSEHWIVTDGTATIWSGFDPAYLTRTILSKHQEIDIKVGYWHQICNETDKSLKIVEIQHGLKCVEEDIIRF